jgi:hypothetical protein
MIAFAQGMKMQRATVTSLIWPSSFENSLQQRIRAGKLSQYREIFSAGREQYVNWGISRVNVVDISSVVMLSFRRVLRLMALP